MATLEDELDMCKHIINEFDKILNDYSMSQTGKEVTMRHIIQFYKQDNAVDEYILRKKLYNSRPMP